MKVAIVGCGSRHKMFRDAIMQDYSQNHEIVAVCDNNEHRLGLAAGAASRPGTNGVASYLAADFATLLSEQCPDKVVVTTPDFLHSDYIIAAMKSGADVICEKPLTIDLSRLKMIIDAQKQTGRKVQVTFNYRYSPARTQIKDMLMRGIIGDITAVDFRWHLDRVHGADYFRRWHRQKENSGGLLVHKATHHFDLLNWWLAAVPDQVFAKGSRAFYRPETAVAFGLEKHGTRCATCPVAANCDFELNMDDDASLHALYREGEHYDGYHRDQCVFDADIGIEDTMSALITYQSGAVVNYTLTAYSPWEGFEVIFQGTKGEITHKHIEVHGVFGGERAHAGDDAITTHLHLAGGTREQIQVPRATGGHGGADPIMLGYIFDPDNMTPDLFNRASDHETGAWSILTGIAANQSIDTGNMVSIPTLLQSRSIYIGIPPYLQSKKSVK